MAKAASKAAAAALACIAACSASVAVVLSQPTKGRTAATIESDAGPDHHRMFVSSEIAAP
ncbi:Uncharacterised protein [Mycobacterium tuberculosis]|nr:Uncharacterised protein [Mycobacterium tuberculosis]